MTRRGGKVALTDVSRKAGVSMITAYPGDLYYIHNLCAAIEAAPQAR